MGTKYHSRIVTDGLSVYVDAANPRSYPGTGNTWYNLVTGAIGGTMVGVGISSTFNGSFNFNGNAYMTFNTLPLVAQSTYSSTVEVFSFRRNIGGFEVIFGGDTGINTQAFYFGHRQNSSNLMMAYWANDLDATTPTTNIAWNHYAATYDVGVGKRTTYFNGNVLANQASGVVNSSSNKFMLGAFSSNGSPNYQFNGLISFFKIYNRALTASEILQNYNATKRRFGL
jgi:hypothetical protein